MRQIEIVTQDAYGSEPQGARERRHHVRAAAALEAQVMDRQSYKRIQGVTANVSAGGCFIQSPDSFAPGTAVQLVLAFGRRRFQCIAMVAHLSEGIGMGLSFPRFNALDWLTEPTKPTG